jgi:uncharacterized protein YjgD (DUF1641 family)
VNLQAVKSLEKSENILQAMDYIFLENEKEIFDEINDDEDIIKTTKF